MSLDWNLLLKALEKTACFAVVANQTREDQVNTGQSFVDILKSFTLTQVFLYSAVLAKHVNAYTFSAK